MVKTGFDVRYDRRVSPQFLEHLAPDGVAASLAKYAKSALFPLDLRLRSDVKSGVDHASLYVGLTAVLKIQSSKTGLLKLSVHQTHQENGGFDSNWSKARTAADLAKIWPDVELYLDRIIPIAALTHGRKEGAVQAAVAAHHSHQRVVLDREVTPSFRSSNYKKSFMEEAQAPILAALRAAGLGFAGVPKSLGNECDALALDADGRVLAIEIKPLGAGTIVWVVAQATMYARILQRWIDLDDTPDDGPDVVLSEMLEQRRVLRLAPAQEINPSKDLRVVPVVALQRGASAEMVRRMVRVRDVLATADVGVEPVEIYEVNLMGELIPLDESRLPDGKPQATPTYVADSNRLAAAWKRASTVLPAEAKAPGVVKSRSGSPVEVDYALPRDYAEHNLLPEVRSLALDLFRDLDISWHQGANGKPSNHLRSSQVQCVNALGQMMRDRTRIERAFGTVLDIASVRDFGEIDASERGRYLTFEFIATNNYFGEARSRGAMSTSVDAAFAYSTSDGVNGLALVEWKFTETYEGADRNADAKRAERRRRYRVASRQTGWPTGPR